MALNTSPDLIKGRKMSERTANFNNQPPHEGLFARIKHLRFLKHNEQVRLQSAVMSPDAVLETTSENVGILQKPVTRRAVLAGGAAIAASAAALAVFGDRDKPSTSTEPVVKLSSAPEYKIPEIKDNLASFSQLRSVIEAYPESKDPNSADFKLRAEALALVDKVSGLEKKVGTFVDAYRSFREPDGTPTLLHLYKQKLRHDLQVCLFLLLLQ